MKGLNPKHQLFLSLHRCCHICWIPPRFFPYPRFIENGHFILWRAQDNNKVDILFLYVRNYAICWVLPHIRITRIRNPLLIFPHCVMVSHRPFKLWLKLWKVAKDFQAERIRQNKNTYFTFASTSYPPGAICRGHWDFGRNWSTWGKPMPSQQTSCKLHTDSTWGRYRTRDSAAVSQELYQRRYCAL